MLLYFTVEELICGGDFLFLTIKNIIGRHIQQNKVKYFFIILCFFAGMIAGILFVGTVSENQSDEISNFINYFCQQAVEQSISPHKILEASIVSNLRTLCLLWICGLFFVLIPVVYAVVAVKGFGIGFTIGYLSFHYGFKGFMLSMASIVPQSIIVLPLLFYLSLHSICFALLRRKKIKGKLDSSRDIKRFTYYFLAGGCFLIFSSFVDAFIVPVFVRSICSLFFT
jgi:stage II sporulation protein M